VLQPTLTTSVGKGASRASRSRASSVHSVTNTTVVNMLAALQAQVAALRKSTVPLVTAPTEDVLSQLDDGDISSVSEHRTRHWVADSTSQNYAYDMAGITTAVDAGSVFASLPKVLVQSQVATSSIAGGKPSVTGTKSVSVARGKKSGVSGVSCPVQAPTFPAVVFDSRPLVYNGESAVGPFLSQFQYTAELRGWPREAWGLHLLTSLEGRARSLLAVESFGRRPTFEEVAQKLKTNFGSDMSAVSHRHELELVRRGEKESIASLGLRVKDLAMKAYPKLDANTRQELAIAPFIRALNNPQLEQAIWATTPTTLQRAMEVALACENGMRVSGKSQRVTVSVHRIGEDADEGQDQDRDLEASLTASVRALSQQVSTMESSMNQKFKSQADQIRAFHSIKAKKADKEATVKCFYCHGMGHIATDCPKKTAGCRERSEKHEVLPLQQDGPYG
jgi:hypothetical protein